MGEADPHSRGRQVFCRYAPAGAFLVRFPESWGDCCCPDVDGIEAAGPGDGADLFTHRCHGSIPRRNAVETGAHCRPTSCVAVGAVFLVPRVHVLKSYQKQRLTSFIDPELDPQGSGYQVEQSKIAVGSGGLWGGKGSQTHGNFLPVPQTDFIFAAFSEEHGFFGALGVLLLYFIVLMRLTQNAQTAPDRAGTFVVMGVVAVLSFHILVNVGMVVGFMPVTGIPLPLMSYGGSSVLFMFLALGIVMNIRMRRFVN